MEKEPLYLFSPQYVKLPKWFLDQEWSNQIVHVKTKFLPANSALFECSLDGLKLQISSPERAILECLYQAPDRFDMMGCYQILEGLANLHPKILQELLESCNSIKVKRLFLFMASKSRHQWLDFVDQPRIDLGTGDRVIVRGGVYIEIQDIDTKRIICIMINQSNFNHADLLLQVIPYIATENTLALRGGTAINLFLRVKIPTPIKGYDPVPYLTPQLAGSKICESSLC
jgi:hypothetical protein